MGSRLQPTEISDAIAIESAVNARAVIRLTVATSYGRTIRKPDAIANPVALGRAGRSRAVAYNLVEKRPKV